MGAINIHHSRIVISRYTSPLEYVDSGVVHPAANRNYVGLLSVKSEQQRGLFSRKHKDDAEHERERKARSIITPEKQYALMQKSKVIRSTSERKRDNEINHISPPADTHRRPADTAVLLAA